MYNLPVARTQGFVWALVEKGVPVSPGDARKKTVTQKVLPVSDSLRGVPSPAVFLVPIERVRFTDTPQYCNDHLKVLSVFGLTAGSTLTGTLHRHFMCPNPKKQPRPPVKEVRG